MIHLVILGPGGGGGPLWFYFSVIGNSDLVMHMDAYYRSVLES
jgi:hypothetical protein